MKRSFYLCVGVVVWVSCSNGVLGLGEDGGPERHGTTTDASTLERSRGGGETGISMGTGGRTAGGGIAGGIGGGMAGGIGGRPASGGSTGLADAGIPVLLPTGRGGAGGQIDAPVGQGGTPSVPIATGPDAARPLPVSPPDAGMAPVAAPTDAAVSGSTQLIPPARPPVVDACTRWAKADCDLRQRCVPYSFEVQYGSLDVCQTLQERSCRLSLLTPSVGESPDHRQACAAGLEQQTCPDRVAGYVAPGCQVIPGKIASDRPCRTGSQCQGGACIYPQVTPPSPCGTCQARSAVGGPCSPGICEIGLICLFQAGLSQGTCVGTKKLGEACNPRDICDNSSCVAGVCTARSAGMIGQDCSTNAVACSTATGIYCNRLTNKCDLNPPLGKDGDPCGSLVDGSTGFVDCAAGTACVGVSGFVRTCLKHLAIGAACDTRQGARCAPPSTCLNSVCAIPEVLTCQ